MIDTVRVKFPVTPTVEQLRSWEKQTRTKATGETTYRYTLNLKLTDDAISVRCTHYPFDYHGNPITTVELSLPKATFGNNFTMLSSLDQAIGRVNGLLSGVDPLPPLDLAQGVLLRLDPCYNHLVGPLVSDYINAIGHLEYPHRRTKHHKDEGAEFRAKHSTTKFYDKMRECCDPAATGILRQETSYLDPKRIAELMGKQRPTLQDVTKDWIVKLLKGDLEKLHLDGTIIADRDTALALLSQQYGSDAGIYYWGLLKAKTDTSRAQLRFRTGLHPRCLDRRLKDITEAGIAPTLTETNAPLPPLEINM
jgi:hypothetical protein